MVLSVLDRYIFRELATPFFFGGALLTFFLLIDRLYHLTDLVVTKGVPFYLVIQLLGFMLPSFLAHSLPMALLIAVLLAGGRLAGDLEIVALKSAGVSLLRVLRPVLIAAAVVAVITATLTLIVNPLANQEFQRQLFRILRTHAVSALHERVFNTTFGGMTIYVEDVSASQVALRGLLVSDERDPTLSRIIFAREGRLLTDDAARRFTLHLIDGAVNEADVAPAAPPKAISAEARPRSGAASATRYRHTRFDVYDMSLSIDSPLSGTPRIDKPEKDLSLGALSGKIAEFQRDPHSRVPFQIERHKRFALPLAALVFTLVAFPLAVRSLRGGRSVALIGSLGILVAYYLMLATLEGAANRLRIAPWLAIWAPNLVFASVGVAFLFLTLREWQWPPMPWLWRLVSAVSAHASATRRHLFQPHSAGGPRDSTHIIDRYLVREYLFFVGISLLVASALFVVVDLAQTLDRYLRVKPPLVYVLEHFVYRLPAALHEGLPIVMLVSTIFLYLALSRNHELTALKAAGVSLYRVSAPILGLGLLAAVASGVFQELALPTLNALGDEVDQVKIRGQAPRHLQSRQRLWLRTADTRFYRVELLHPGTDDIYGLTLLEIDSDFRLTSRLDARRAHWTPVGWELTDGAYRELGRQGQVQTIPFVWTSVELGETIQDFTRIQKSIESMSYRELREYITRLEAAGFQVRKYLVELYSKLSFPLVNLVMVLVAIPFAIQAPRSGRIFGVGLAIVIMAGYLVVHYVSIAFARADLLPPLVAAWTANVIFLGVGVSLVLRART